MTKISIVDKELDNLNEAKDKCVKKVEFLKRKILKCKDLENRKKTCLNKINDITRHYTKRKLLGLLELNSNYQLSKKYLSEIEKELSKYNSTILKLEFNLAQNKLTKLLTEIRQLREIVNGRSRRLSGIKKTKAKPKKKSKKVVNKKSFKKVSNKDKRLDQKKQMFKSTNGGSSEAITTRFSVWTVKKK